MGEKVLVGETKSKNRKESLSKCSFGSKFIAVVTGTASQRLAYIFLNGTRNPTFYHSNESDVSKHHILKLPVMVFARVTV